MNEQEKLDSMPEEVWDDIREKVSLMQENLPDGDEPVVYNLEADSLTMDSGLETTPSRAVTLPPMNMDAMADLAAILNEAIPVEKTEPNRHERRKQAAKERAERRLLEAKKKRMRQRDARRAKKKQRKS